MMYAIAHFLRDKLPFIWNLIDVVNSWLFSLRFGRKMKSLQTDVLAKFEMACDMKIMPLNKVQTDKIIDFFASQPEEAFTFFKPHGFDRKNIKKLQKNKSFLAYILLDGSDIAGYCFIRSFFHGKGFRGRMVDINHRGKGLGTLMNRMMNDIGFGIGLRLFETVSKDNVASYKSALSASNIRVIEEMPHNELYLEILK